MHLKEIREFEGRLESYGYRKITSCKAKDRDDFEWYKAFYSGEKDENDEDILLYQVFFEFWNFMKYGGGHWGISVTVLPESVRNNAGRRDLELSVDWLTDIDKVEEVAKGFYEFISKFDKI